MTRTDLVFIQIFPGQFFYALLSERYDNQSDKNVDEEKRKHDEVYNVINSYFHSNIGAGSFIFFSGIHRKLTDPENPIGTFNTTQTNYWS